MPAAAVLSFDHSVSEKTMAELVQSAYLTKPNKLLSSFCGYGLCHSKKAIVFMLDASSMFITSKSHHGTFPALLHPSKIFVIWH